MVSPKSRVTVHKSQVSPTVESMSGPAEHAQPVSAARSPRAVAIFITLFLVLLAADIGLKAWSFTPGNVGPDGTPLIPNILALRLTYNEGAIFGSMQGYKWFFVVASAVAAGLILYFFWQSSSRERATHIALALILAGAMGNLYDRLEHNAVRDMLLLFPDVKLPWGLRWWGGSNDIYPWIFNLADVYLLVGIGLILLRSLFVKPAAGK
jgi:lipoprotein signal peptidase